MSVSGLRWGISELFNLPLHGLGQAAARGNLRQLAAGLDRAAHVEAAGKAFPIVELGADLELFLPDAFGPQAVEALQRARQRAGLSYTVHLPIWSVDPSSGFAPIRRSSVDVLVGAIRSTRPLEPEVYVHHATGEVASEFSRRGFPQALRGAVLGQFQLHAAESLRLILKESGLPSRRLAIETIGFPLELTLELAQELDLSICFDSGHVLAGFSGPVELSSGLERCLPRLAEVHLHDAPALRPEEGVRLGQDHRRLGRGDLNVQQFLGRLEEGAFRGPVVFELGMEDALASLELIRSLPGGDGPESR